MKLSSIVNVVITRLTTFLSQAGFGSALVMGPSNKIGTDLVRVYSDLDAVAEDFATSDPEYKWADAYFGQNPRPTQLFIGKRSTTVAQNDTITVDTATEGHDYAATLNGVTYTYTAQNGDTTALIASGLAALMAADTTVTITTGGLSVVSVTAVTAGTPFTLTTTDALMTLAHVTANNGIVEDLNTLVQSSGGNDWFALAMVGETDADKLLAAPWIEAHDKIFANRGTASDYTTTGGDAVGNAFFAAGYTQTFTIYTPTATEYPEAAWLGRQLPQAPGSSTWANKTLTGITSATLTDSQVANLRAKNVNFYTSVGTIKLTLDGKMASGEWVDIIVGLAWLKNLIATNVFNTIYQAEKVDYDDRGIALVSGVVGSSLQAGVLNRILSASNNTPYNGAAYVVTVPKADDIPAATKATRKLTGVTFRGHLAGAIQTADVEGTVEY